MLLQKRDWNYDSLTAAGSARWAFFAIFIILIIIVIIGTLRVNKKRAKHGIDPLYGTRWMTPPSYIQSQSQYNRSHGGDSMSVHNNYVPTYTAEATENDMGYYDSNGKFHPNVHHRPSFGPQINPPESARTHDGQANQHIPLNPIGSVGEHNPQTASPALPTDEDYMSPPPGPPPPHSMPGAAHLSSERNSEEVNTSTKSAQSDSSSRNVIVSSTHINDGK
ncbi:Piso0_000718 [Millerozyma farinosa CBS 7064]|uniref:Piso0_000718 protein n=1 Tax=Pichia sorbitophila (strain ATCC MYA-4447 / BCRC 22081 / CBS 7064 / NBRC 10061 / NRRL Y-12695) TaxID=559304 RepID=G8YPV5_PICSO|nr:Piso0_000718 [Millerozyma farinosa CBS 7064]